MYKINQSLSITTDLGEDLAIVNGAVVSVETDYHGDIHLFEHSRAILHGDLYGTVNASGNSTVEYYGTIHNGVSTYGDSGKNYCKPLSLMAHVIGLDSQNFKHNAKVHRQLECGELNPPLYPSDKIE
ncbi:hypothetical protein RWV98_05530 [Agathobaculum sp. NTUH-O15-33]|uniref:hypothetical protein n=1 Tax=Agathobaculum sp. NTUH-O15-33 TaxID=3079302 RepID=UPI0029588F4A|nr:hypothetical protein [Agathobaculum sp. NTUH-O15-33]WNX85728.1 hypothetical protein RWV98_05530 [Agathobaculum sp. NTUH-O15-33]